MRSLFIFCAALLQTTNASGAEPLTAPWPALYYRAGDNPRGPAAPPGQGLDFGMADRAQAVERQKLSVSYAKIDGQLSQLLTRQAAVLKDYEAALAARSPLRDEAKTRVEKMTRELASLRGALDAIRTLQTSVPEKTLRDPSQAIARIARGLESELAELQKNTKESLPSVVQTRALAQDAIFLSRQGVPDDVLKKLLQTIEQQSKIAERLVEAGRPVTERQARRMYLRVAQAQGIVSEGGLYNQEVIGEQGAKRAVALSGHLRSDPYSKEGDAIRFHLNRSLVIQAHSTNETQVEIAAGSDALLLAADSAFRDGKNDEGQELVNAGAHGVDFALGLLPGIGAANDASHIISGIITGFDFTGKRMTSSDYALRGLGVVLGMTVGGKVVAAGVKIGVTTISRTFVKGATLIRELGYGQRVSAALIPLVGRELPVARATASFVGNNVPDFAKTTVREKEILRYELDAMTRNLGKVEIQSVTTGKPLNEALVRAGNEPAWMEAGENWLAKSKDQTITAYRVHVTEDTATRSWLMLVDPRLMSRAELLQRYALPGKIDDIKYVSQLQIPAGTTLVLGPVGPNKFGTGGGFQIQISDGTRVEKEWVKFTELFKGKE